MTENNEIPTLQPVDVTHSPERVANDGELADSSHADRQVEKRAFEAEIREFGESFLGGEPQGVVVEVAIEDAAGCMVTRNVFMTLPPGATVVDGVIDMGSWDTHTLTHADAARINHHLTSRYVCAGQFVPVQVKDGLKVYWVGEIPVEVGI